MSEILVRLILVDFSLSFYTTFSNPDPHLIPCGYFTYLIMMLHVSSSPNLYTTALAVLRNDLRDLRKWRKCKLAFPSLGRPNPLAGVGSTKTKIKMNTKWLSLAAIVPAENDATRPVLTQPLHHRVDNFTRCFPRPSSVKDMQTSRPVCRLKSTMVIAK
jgi:hypothetical protein